MAAVATTVETMANGKRWHDLYPELGTGPLPIEPYISQAYFEREREQIFRRAWLNIGREEEIPKAGNYLVKDLPVCNTSILIVRGKDGRIRAFHNVCSHRCNKLVWEQDGTRQRFTCRFHGWTYGLDGHLSFVPDEGRFFDLQKKELGLTPVATDTWEGFLFVNLDSQPQESLKEYLGELGQELSGYPFAEVSATCFSWQTELRTNWKVLQDAFQEVYHLPFLHRRSVPDSFSSKSNPFAHALDIKLYPRHHRMSLYGNPEHQPSPVEGLAYRFGALLIRNGYSTDNLPAGANPTGSLSWSLDINVFFPNFFVDVADGTYFTYNMWPLAVDRTLWEVRTYYPKARSAGQRFSQEYSKIFFRDVLMEDGSTVEATQSVLASGAKKHFVLHDEELLVRHSHKVREGLIGFSENGKGEQCMPNRLLPEAFLDLEPLAPWALPTEAERNRKRLASTMEEIQAFYDTLLPRMEAVFAHLEPFPLDDMPEEARRLMYLTLSLAEVAPAVEFFKQPRVIDGYDPTRFIPVQKYGAIQ